MRLIAPTWIFLLVFGALIGWPLMPNDFQGLGYAALAAGVVSVFVFAAIRLDSQLRNHRGWHLVAVVSAVAIAVILLTLMVKSSPIWLPHSR